MAEAGHRSHEHDWFPKDIKTARAVSFFNLSVAYVIKGEIDAASKHFNSVILLDNNTSSFFLNLTFKELCFKLKCVSLFEKKQPLNVYYMKIYLDLLDGK